MADERLHRSPSFVALYFETISTKAVSVGPDAFKRERVF
jgi:hypothetical protein